MDGDTPGLWLRAAAGGDQAAWACLVARYNALLWSVARSFGLGPVDASDVVQTSWLRLVEHLDRIEDPDRVGSWLATTARNECLAVLRRQRRQSPTRDVDEREDSGPAPDDNLLATERETVLWRALQQVSERCRTLLRVLAADPPPSYEEVGAALSMPVGSIGPTRARCLLKLRRLIDDAETPATAQRAALGGRQR
jgi:RNA polymerase sigma factor (sigma-70 family)